jgi:O-antigen ligase/tetratricopeptide (TPR) repeat protein
VISRLQTAQGLRPDRQTTALLAQRALLAAGIYLVLIGGTTIGETDPALRFVNGLIGGALILAYLFRGPALMDRVDRGVLAALLFFLAATTLSSFPRQSFDAALTALAYTAAFFVARGLFADERMRSVYVTVVIASSVILTLLFAQLWLGPIFEWWARVDFRVVPPLSFELAGFPWGHRHDVTTLIVMLYPAWWIGRPSPLRRVARIVIGILVALIVLVDGSRTVWLAIAMATAVPLLTWIARHRWSLWGAALAVAGIGVTAAALTFTGVGSSLVERGLNAATLDWRTAMWGPLLDQWTTQPVAGAGPGSFPWILQLTGYFDTNSWAPRHPDSVIVQTLAEGGLLGLAAVGVLAATVAPVIIRGRTAAAQWSLTLFAVSAIGATPTDFGFLLVVALAWTAYAAPRASATIRTETPRRRGLSMVSAAMFAVVAVVYGMTTVASFAYAEARAAVEESRLADAHGPLALARAMDPSLALYPRQEGATYILEGAPDRAAASLERAVRLNPADDLAWRTLALAKDALGDVRGRDAALNVAVSLQRSDATNLMLRAYWWGQAGRQEQAADALAEVTQAWPTIAYAPGWSVLADTAGGSSTVVAEAAARWLSHAPMPERPFDQGLWLTALADQTDLRDRAISESPWGEPLSLAALAAMVCDPGTDDMLERMPADARQSTLFWALSIHSAALSGSSYGDAARMLELMDGRIIPPALMVTLNPLDENGLSRGDRWGYRRPSIVWPAADIELPASPVGELRWTVMPQDAVAQSGLSDQLGECGARNDR